jgi:hypothetical protein
MGETEERERWYRMFDPCTAPTIGDGTRNGEDGDIEYLVHAQHQQLWMKENSKDGDVDG